MLHAEDFETTEDETRGAQGGFEGPPEETAAEDAPTAHPKPSRRRKKFFKVRPCNVPNPAIPQQRAPAVKRQIP